MQGGILARSTRGGIGEQWWSRRFIEVMESFGVGGRLTRGRAYARKGQVISLEVEAGEVTARVQGSRVTPYQVRIGLARFTELIWAKAEVVLAEQAIHSARLLAGEFPPELESVLAGIGAPLFPGRLADLALSCSCPDQVIPCKHLAATFYLLAERFDDDPFLILRWRGRGREALLDRLRQLRADDLPDEPAADLVPASGTASGIVTGAGSDAGTAAIVAPVLSSAMALEGLPLAGSGAPGERVVPPDRAVSGFWTAADTPSLPPHPELPVDLLLRLLPPPGAGLGGSRLLAQLGSLYDRLPAVTASPGSPRRAAPGASAQRKRPSSDTSESSGPAKSTR